MIYFDIRSKDDSYKKYYPDHLLRMRGDPTYYVLSKSISIGCIRATFKGKFQYLFKLSTWGTKNPRRRKNLRYCLFRHSEIIGCSVLVSYASRQDLTAASSALRSLKVSSKNDWCKYGSFKLSVWPHPKYKHSSIRSYGR